MKFGISKVNKTDLKASYTSFYGKIIVFLFVLFTLNSTLSTINTLFLCHFYFVAYPFTLSRYMFPYTLISTVPSTW